MRFKAAIQKIEEGASLEEVARADPSCFIQYHGGIERYFRLNSSNKTPRDFKSEVIVLWGVAGSGKTRSAHHLFKNGEDGKASMRDVQWTGQFLLNYDESVETVIFDDFDYKTMSRVTFLKLCDQYEMAVNVKNGCANWRPKRIVFTCNDDPKFWYNYTQGNEDAAVHRRLDIVCHYDKEYDVSKGDLHPGLFKYLSRVLVPVPLTRQFAECGPGLMGGKRGEVCDSEMSPDFSMFTRFLSPMSPLILSD